MDCGDVAAMVLLLFKWMMTIALNREPSKKRREMYSREREKDGDMRS